MAELHQIEVLLVLHSNEKTLSRPIFLANDNMSTHEISWADILCWDTSMLLFA